ncbi:MAG: hypothetical protein IPH95_04780 [Candidatus Promineofilum sp.]|nr:hypothetical protein [Promineifilum sp.]
MGCIPTSLAGWRDEWIASLQELAQHEKVVAIGRSA